MAITYIHPETNEPVAKEIWRWVASYNDGSQLEQFEIKDNKPVFHQSKEIDAARLVELQLVHDTYPAITFQVPQGATPVHFYRHKWVVEEWTDENTGEHMNREWKTKIWCIGFRLTTKEGKQYWLAYVDEYNHMIITNDINAFLERALPEGL